MNIHKLGATKVNINLNNTLLEDCIQLILPIPKNDLTNSFLRVYFEKSRNPLTPENIANKWEHCLRALVNKGRFMAFDEDVVIIETKVVKNDTDKLQLNGLHKKLMTNRIFVDPTYIKCYLCNKSIDKSISYDFSVIHVIRYSQFANSVSLFHNDEYLNYCKEQVNV